MNLDLTFVFQFPPSGAVVPDPGLCGGEGEAAEPRGAELPLLPRQSGLQVRTHLDLYTASADLTLCSP